MFFKTSANSELAKLKTQLSGQQKSLLASLLASAWVVEARDPYTGGHLWRVAMYSARLATALGLSRLETNRIAMAGFLHDLGKIGIPDAILRKPEKLTDDEYAVIKTHPRIGERLIAHHPFAPLVIKAIVGHHEMPNGRGYPEGLLGAEMSLDAKIVAISDAFDAMTSSRPYRKGMPIAKALNIIESELGQQFDQQCGEVFVRLGRAGEFDHIVSHSDDGIPLGHCMMCGPTLVRVRNAQAGDTLACPSCCGEYQWAASETGELTAKPTGHKASAEALAPKADELLIESLIGQWENVLELINS
ncbi:HD-GYP domain-containing protein [Chitinibacter fontanus]|uniref:HD-GYP domain-containing protein n=1 Tax=Chitinibacter fontanus TaxID=1737446 RepID=A0A7D5V992_9NEIS|nr:HD-GYP domain-containing protein [Chitinibacter fontanus]QLI81457.1 HD-GYP domain-containing protein [Chitinibacter fontanus]